MRLIRLLFLDLLVVALAAIGALFLRDNLDLEPERLAALGPYLFFALISGAIILPLVGTNRGFWRYSTFNDLVRVCIAAVLIVLAATSLVFAYNRLDGLARAIPILHVLLAIAFMCALRAAMRLRHGARSRRASAPALAATPRGETVLIVGLNPVAELFLRAVRQFSVESIRVAGVLGLSDRHRGRFLHGVSILGLPDELIAVLRRLEVHGVEVDRIVVAVAPSELSQSARDALVGIEDGSGIVVDYFAERLGFSKRPSHAPSSGRISVDGGGSGGGALPSLREIFEEGLLHRSYWRWKRIFDFVVALALIVATAPLMVLVAVAVAIDVGVPVIFWQERPGALGGRLRLYKFRTMRSAHDARGVRIPETQRSSLAGRFLRRTRLDELPRSSSTFSWVRCRSSGRDRSCLSIRLRRTPDAWPFVRASPDGRRFTADGTSARPTRRPWTFGTFTTPASGSISWWRSRRCAWWWWARRRTRAPSPGPGRMRKRGGPRRRYAARWATARRRAA